MMYSYFSYETVEPIPMQKMQCMACGAKFSAGQVTEELYPIYCWKCGSNKVVLALAKE